MEHVCNQRRHTRYQRAWAQAKGNRGVVRSMHAVPWPRCPVHMCVPAAVQGTKEPQGSDRMHKQAFLFYATRTGTSGTQAVNFVSKLLQNNSGRMDVVIKHIKGLLEFFKEFRVPKFENHCTIAKQISTGLEIKI